MVTEKQIIAITVLIAIVGGFLWWYSINTETIIIEHPPCYTTFGTTWQITPPGTNHSHTWCYGSDRTLSSCFIASTGEVKCHTHIINITTNTAELSNGHTHMLNPGSYH